jgi:hypothetical protein
MTISELHYAFKVAMDRIDSNSQTDFNKGEIDYLLNEAQLIFLKTRSSTSNSKQKGFEATQKRIDDLSTLLVKYPEQQPLTPVSNEVNLSILTYEYYSLVRIYAEVQYTDCVKNVQLKFVQHDDLNDVLKDPFNSASQDAIPYNFGKSSTSSSTSIYLYPTTGTVNKVYIEYLKLPNKVSFGGYAYVDGVVYPPSTLEFPEHTHLEIVDIAANIAAMNIENPEYIRLKKEKLFINE